LVVDFSVVDNGSMSYTFIPVIDTGDVTVVGQVWNYLNVVPQADYNPSFTAQFLAAGPTPVCFTVDAYDPQSQPCSTTACKVVTIYTDSICATLAPDFTIANIQGNTVTFEDLSTFDGVITGRSWDFGDATTATAPSPMHTFSGNGPFEVCLTVAGAPSCVATACKWLYLGPGNIPCPTLLQPGFLSIVFDNTVGVLDTSITTGMSYSVAWDFGDGTTGTGTVAYHSYASGGGFSVCETISLWGPLTPDTCVSTICTPVYITTLGMGEEAPTTPIRAWPVPAQERLFVEGLPRDCDRLDLLDAFGRIVHTYPVSGARSAELDTQAFSRGVYMLRPVGAGVSRNTRVVLE
jgi:PKD repeat protein